MKTLTVIISILMMTGMAKADDDLRAQLNKTLDVMATGVLGTAGLFGAAKMEVDIENKIKDYVRKLPSDLNYKKIGVETKYDIKTYTQLRRAYSLANMKYEHAIKNKASIRETAIAQKALKYMSFALIMGSLARVNASELDSNMITDVDLNEVSNENTENVFEEASIEGSK